VNLLDELNPLFPLNLSTTTKDLDHMQISEDTAMLSALKDNNLDAYQYFFMKYYKPLCIKACQLTGNMEKAKEIVQQLFIEVWKSGTETLNILRGDFSTSLFASNADN
jgi:DNA-directed RNA polymerase specialized sigma24 family protein